MLDMNYTFPKCTVKQAELQALPGQGGTASGASQLKDSESCFGKYLCGNMRVALERFKDR